MKLRRYKQYNMCYINNERYENRIENLNVFNGKFICAYLPVYGLVKVNGIVFKISGHDGVVNLNEVNVIVEYVREIVHIDGFHDKELSEKEIYEILFCNIIKEVN